MIIHLVFEPDSVSGCFSIETDAGRVNKTRLLWRIQWLLPTLLTQSTKVSELRPLAALFSLSMLTFYFLQLPH